MLQFGEAPNVLVVHPSLPVKSVRELIALANRNPGKSTIRCPATAVRSICSPHCFRQWREIDMFHIPYKGSAQATTEMLSGEVKVGFPGIAGMLQYIKDGRLRALAVTVRRQALTGIARRTDDSGSRSQG